MAPRLKCVPRPVARRVTTRASTANEATSSSQAISFNDTSATHLVPSPLPARPQVPSTERPRIPIRPIGTTRRKKATTAAIVMSSNASSPASSLVQRQPPQQIKVKRRRDDEPVQSLFVEGHDGKRLKTAIKPAPKFYFRHVGTADSGTAPFQPRSISTSSPLKPPVLRGSDGQSLPGTDSPPTGTKRKAGPEVKRFTLSKRMRSHPYNKSSPAAAVFERMHDKQVTKEAEEEGERQRREREQKEKEKELEAAKNRKKPRTHPKERAAIAEERKMTRSEREDEQRAGEAELMMMQYLELDERNALGALPPTPLAKGKKDTVGGGVGGGSWSEPKKTQQYEEAGMDEEDEDGDWVYDVYYREEHTDEAEAEKAKEGTSYGLIVFEGEDDEEWWYEGGNAEYDSDAAGAEDDEDSNAEDYHTNDYPDEPDSDDDDDDYSDLDAGGGRWRSSAARPRWGKRRGSVLPGEEEYDLENDSSDDEEDTSGRLARDIWGLRNGD